MDKKRKKKAEVKKINQALLHTAMRTGKLYERYNLPSGGEPFCSEKIAHLLALKHTEILLNANFRMREEFKDPDFSKFTLEFAALAIEGKLNIPGTYSWCFFWAALDLAIPFANVAQTYLYAQEFSHRVSVICKAESIGLKTINQKLLLLRSPTLKNYNNLQNRFFNRVYRELGYARSKQLLSTKGQKNEP